MDETAVEAAPVGCTRQLLKRRRKSVGRMYGFEVQPGLSGVVDDSAGAGGCGFEVRREGRRINAVAMIRYGGGGGERDGLGKFRWRVVEVRLRG